MPSTDDGPADDDATTQSTKKIRSQPPDVIVAVGSGESVREFKCYKVILSFASVYLDAMIGSCLREGSLSRIEFPDKDPEEWKLFYEFIAPDNLGKERRNATIDNENVLLLLPWFHEFQMCDCVSECDQYLAYKFFGKDPTFFWSNKEHLETRKDKFGMMMNVLQLAHRYDLSCAKDEMEKKVVDLLNIPGTLDLFDFSVAKSLLQLVLPLEMCNETELRMREGKSTHLWRMINNIMSPHISHLSQEMIDDKINFPHIFYPYMQLKIAQDSADIKNRNLTRAKRIIAAIIHFVPKDTPAYTYYTHDCKQLGITMP